MFLDKRTSNAVHDLLDWGAAGGRESKTLLYCPYFVSLWFNGNVVVGVVLGHHFSRAVPSRDRFPWRTVESVVDDGDSTIATNSSHPASQPADQPVSHSVQQPLLSLHKIDKLSADTESSERANLSGYHVGIGYSIHFPPSFGQPLTRFVLQPFFYWLA